MKFLTRQVDAVPLSEAFIVSSESSLRPILCLLCDGGICRLFGVSGEKGTEGPEATLSGAAGLMERMDEKSDADQSE
jgi:hypothetical protein